VITKNIALCAALVMLVTLRSALAQQAGPQTQPAMTDAQKKMLADAAWRSIERHQINDAGKLVGSEPLDLLGRGVMAAQVQALRELNLQDDFTLSEAQRAAIVAAQQKWRDDLQQYMQANHTAALEWYRKLSEALRKKDAEAMKTLAKQRQELLSSVPTTQKTLEETAKQLTAAQSEKLNARLAVYAAESQRKAEAEKAWNKAVAEEVERREKQKKLDAELKDLP